MAEFDLAVVGGGISGAAIARDAAGRGLNVLLVEKNDLGAGASFAAAGMLRDGLAEIRRGDLYRARAALNDREDLLRTAPHVVRPMRLVVPGPTAGRSGWRTRLELFACDHLAWRSAPPARTIDLTHHVHGDPLRRRYTFGFEFSAAAVDSARLAVLNAIDAGIRGASIRTRTRLLRAERSDAWTLVLNARGRRQVTTARAVVNAAGAWAGLVDETVLRCERRTPMRFVKSCHIVVRRLFDHANGYALDMPGREIVYVLPFATDFTLIEAAHEPFVGNPDSPIPGLKAVQYLCDAVNAHFRDTITAHDVVWSFADVSGRAMSDAGTGEAALLLDDEGGRAPLLTVIGGSLNACRRTGEAAIDKLMHYFAARPSWTRGAPLPGGDFPSLEELATEIARQWRFLEPAHALRLAQAYGRRTELILGNARSLDDLGPGFGTDLTAAEVRYLMRHEFAETADDVLSRRSRLELRTGKDEQESLARFMAAECGRTPP
jgi:glycerol-3-phosphate dehydrogenase